MCKTSLVPAFPLWMFWIFSVFSVFYYSKVNIYQPIYFKGWASDTHTYSTLLGNGLVDLCLTCCEAVVGTLYHSLAWHDAAKVDQPRPIEKPYKIQYLTVFIINIKTCCDCFKQLNAWCQLKQWLPVRWRTDSEINLRSTWKTDLWGKYSIYSSLNAECLILYLVQW